MSPITKNYQIEGISPLLMHNGRLADPMSEYSIDMKKLSGRRNKTIEDHKALANLEYIGSLYTDDNNRPCIPGELLEACILSGAKKTKNGVKIKTGIMCDGIFPLIYDGPQDANILVGDKKYTDRRGVVVGNARIFRTRPRFNKWSLNFSVVINLDLVDESVVTKAIEDAGCEVGLGDYRPKYGRFKLI